MKKYIGTKEVEAMPMTLGELINKSGRNPYENDGKMHGYSYKELAEAYGIPMGTLKSRVFHVKKLLREKLNH